MNIYTYWYFVFYIFYQKFCKDKHFDIFATGLFSVFVSFFIVGIYGVIIYLTNDDGVLLNARNCVYIAISVLVSNYIFFSQGEKLRRQYHTFTENRSVIKDLFSLLLTILSIVVFIIGVRINNN